MTRISSPSGDSEIKYITARAKTRNIIAGIFYIEEKVQGTLFFVAHKTEHFYLAICSAAILRNNAIKYRDVIPENEYADTVFDNNYEAEQKTSGKEQPF